MPEFTMRPDQQFTISFSAPGLFRTIEALKAFPAPYVEMAPLIADVEAQMMATLTAESEVRSDV